MYVKPLCANRIGFRIEVARAYVIKASRHLRFRPAGVDHYLLPGSGIGRVRCGDELAAPAEGFRVSLIDRQFMDNGVGTSGHRSPERVPACDGRAPDVRYPAGAVHWHTHFGFMERFEENLV